MPHYRSSKMHSDIIPSHPRQRRGVMDKEKQAFEKWYSADDAEIENTIGREIVKGTKFSVITGIVFYGGYHARDEEIAALKAEIKRKNEALKAARQELDNLWSFVGDGLMVAEFHQNGNLEPLDNFFFENDQNARHIIKQALKEINNG
jgi:hypothetical protein